MRVLVLALVLLLAGCSHRVLDTRLDGEPERPASNPVFECTPGHNPRDCA
jgi:hypothetical protein